MEADSSDTEILLSGFGKRLRLSDIPPPSIKWIEGRARSRQRRRHYLRLALAVTTGVLGVSYASIRTYSSKIAIETTVESDETIASPSSTLSFDGTGYMVPSSLDSCMAPYAGIQRNDLIGMSEQAVREMLPDNSFRGIRIVYRDGHCVQAAVMDYNAARLNIAVEDGRVIRAAQF